MCPDVCWVCNGYAMPIAATTHTMYMHIVVVSIYVYFVS